MKISTVFTATFLAVACLFQSTTAETEASTQLRGHKQTTPGAICYKLCPSGQYCPRGETSCRAPTAGLCFNPATSLFQHGCDLGFTCSNGKCVYKSTVPESEAASGALCCKTCPTGQFCPRGETACRAPTAGLCFNPATSLFQHGCAAGFTCSNGKCVHKSKSTTAKVETTPQSRVPVNKQSSNGALCYKACPTGQYCPRGETACRAPTGTQCFNPATSLFQTGCARGFKCSHGKCVYN
jgi:hypothetical protein